MSATGRLLTYVLRHRPDAIGLSLDARGAVPLDALAAALVAHGHAITADELRAIAEADDKGRFALEGETVRARQGHSIAVVLDLVEREPPEHLFHGTSQRFVPRIRREGLVRGARHHVHLSKDRATAEAVGKRRSAPVVLVVRAHAMHAAGHKFYRTDNGVWLVDAVPPAFLVG